MNRKVRILWTTVITIKTYYLVQLLLYKFISRAVIGWALPTTECFMKYESIDDWFFILGWYMTPLLKVVFYIAWWLQKEKKLREFWELRYLIQLWLALLFFWSMRKFYFKFRVKHTLRYLATPLSCVESFLRLLLLLAVCPKFSQTNCCTYKQKGSHTAHDFEKWLVKKVYQLILHLRKSFVTVY